VDFTKIRKILPEFEPRWTVAEGIDELVLDMRRFGPSNDDFEGPRYVRLAKIREHLMAGRLDNELRMRSAPAVAVGTS
jgi:hypothetical protein